jgi:hypothetical protein
MIGVGDAEYRTAMERRRRFVKNEHFGEYVVRL